jgi:hypothetical protein
LFRFPARRTSRARESVHPRAARDSSESAHGQFHNLAQILPRLDFDALDPYRVPFHAIMFPNLVPVKDALFPYIRSGDLFTEDAPQSEYTEPPIGYYRDVMAMRNWSRVVLCAMDTYNPCVLAVKGLGAEYET